MRKFNGAGLGLGLLIAGVACNRASQSAAFVGSPDLPPSQPGEAGPPPTTPLQPQFGPTVTAAVAPPPISGGSMLVLQDGHTVVAGDPDRDLVYVVDVSTQTLLQTVALQAGDEPGRIAEDGAGRVHVALRGGGALVTLDPASGSVLARRAVCPAPRGVAWDATTDTVVVACATGELVTLPSAGGAPTRTVTVERDLRDVTIANGAISVTSFRSSEVLDLAANGSVAMRSQVATQVAGDLAANVSPQVAWRTIVDSAGYTVVLHQLHSDASISTASISTIAPGGAPGSAPGSAPGGYGGGDQADGGASVPVVFTDLTILAPNPPPVNGFEQPGRSVVSDDVLLGAALAVDVAISPDGAHALIAAAGNADSPLLQTALYYQLEGSGERNSLPMAQLPGPAVAVAFDGVGEALVQTLEPASLWIVYPGGTQSTEIPLSSISRADSGHEIFHTQAGAMIACASCHPEGGDDGHVWILDGDERRTPSLRGTIAGTAPYHWPGDMADFPTLVHNVYTMRMSGAVLDPEALAALQGWVESIPAPPAPSWVDPAAEQRGEALFASTSTGCTTCHNGPKLTNNATLDVGTGGAFQVPPLVGVGWRTPLLHDGCANTLTDRFTSCATPAHGGTANLSADNVSDLVAYLETL
jgi:cytochrome c553